MIALMRKVAIPSAMDMLHYATLHPIMAYIPLAWVAEWCNAIQHTNEHHSPTTLHMAIKGSEACCDMRELS